MPFSEDCSSLHSVRCDAMSSMGARYHLWISVHSLVKNVRWTKGWNIMPASDSKSKCSRAPSNTRRHAISSLGTAVSIRPCCFQRSSHTATGKGCATRSVRARLSAKRSARSIRVRLYSMSARQECSSYVRRICNSHLAQRLGQAIHLQRTTLRCEDALPHLSPLLSRLFASSSTWQDLATPLHGDAEWYST